MRRNLPVAISFLALLGCATQPSLQSRMSVYIGADERTLVQQFGVPDKMATVNGVRYLAYNWQRVEVDNNGAPYGWFFPSDFESGLYPRVINQQPCEMIFLLREHKVFNFAVRGRDCS
jgi:hypothetical protein